MATLGYIDSMVLFSSFSQFKIRRSGRKQEQPDENIFLQFSSFTGFFFALANEFFAPFFQLLNLFSILFVFERKQKHFGIPREGTRFIFVPQVELFCPLGEFLSFGPAHFEFFRFTQTSFFVHRKNSKWAGPQDKNSPSGQKSSTFGTKINLVPSLGIPKCFCFLSKTNKIENKLSS